MDPWQTLGRRQPLKSSDVTVKRWPRMRAAWAAATAALVILTLPAPQAVGEPEPELLIERVSVSSAGTDADRDSGRPSISGDGRFVAFESRATNLVPGAGRKNDHRDIFVHDRATGQTARVSVSSDGAEADKDSANPAISADGRFVAFESKATNLVPGAGRKNDHRDIFVHDRTTGQTTRVSVAADGA